MKRRVCTVVTILSLASCSLAANTIVQRNSYYTQGVDYVINQETRVLTILSAIASQP